MEAKQNVEADHMKSNSCGVKDLSDGLFLFLFACQFKRHLLFGNDNFPEY